MTVYHIAEGDRFYLKGRKYVVKDTVSVQEDGHFQLTLVDIGSGQIVEVMFHGLKCVPVKSKYIPVESLKKAFSTTFDHNNQFHNVYEIQEDGPRKNAVLLVYLY